MDSDEAQVVWGCFGPKAGASAETEKKVRYHSKSSSFSRWWGGSAAADAARAAAEGEAGAEPDLYAQLTDELLGLDLDSAPATRKQPSPIPTAPMHERKRSWPFSGVRKVVPQAPPPLAQESRSSEDSAAASASGSPYSIEDSSHHASELGDRDAEPGAQEAQQEPSSGRPQGYRRLWQSITSVRKGDKVTATDLASQTHEYTVESLVRAVLSLKPSQPVLEAAQLVAGLRTLDSRAVAALLKELNKVGAPHRASELFDVLRTLPDDHELSGLVDLYTYTTVISQCGGHQQLRRALELVAEMRGKGIQCNVHTFSALMGVCVKCNECELALDVYEQLLAEGCTPNLVTYNILIDAYSRTGQWAKAVDVLEPISRQGLTPEARTYNSIISACGKAGQPAAAIRVYERMMGDGVEPTGTTYTSIISAFGRAGQVEDALRVYRDMASRGCEPNVITYSSLISICERAGRAEAALELFHEMKAAGVRPNGVTYNGVVAACAQKGLWQKAAELVDGMPAAGCRPDGTTYSALIAALERGGQWRQALQALEKAQAAGVRPDAGAYNSVLGALWSSGRLPAVAKAVQLLSTAQRQGVVRLQTLPAGEATAPAYTEGAAFLVTLRWLCHFRDGLSAAAALAANSGTRSLVLVRGKHAPPDHTFDAVRDSLAAMFAAFSVPATVTLSAQGLLITADARMLPSWAASASGLALLSILDYSEAVPAATAPAVIKDDRAAEMQCGKAFTAVREFEAAHSVRGLDPEALCTPAATALRHDVISCITALSSGLQLREEAAHDAVQLANRLLSLAQPTQQPPAPACAAALLLLACRQAGNAAAVLRHGQVVLQAAGLPVSAVLEAEQRVLTTLGANPAAISSLRVLHLYLERLGCDDAALQKCQLAHVMALTASDMVAKAALSPAFVRFDPSVVAAACLLKARQSMGLVPAWPSALNEMTGYSAEEPVALGQCVELLQLLSIVAT